MRFTLVLPILFLAACTNNQSGLSSTRSAGLDIADAALANGAPQTALQIAQRVLQSDPANVPALLRAAAAQAALGQRDEAARGFRRVLASAPDNADAEIGLGRLELATDATAAAGLFQRVIDENPRSVAALIDLGIAKDLVGQHGDAQSVYRRALAVEPDRSAISVNLGLSLALSGNAEEALQILRPLASGPGSSPRVRQDLAVALTLAGDNTAAASILDQDLTQKEVVTNLAMYRLLQPGT